MLILCYLLGYRDIFDFFRFYLFWSVNYFFRSSVIIVVEIMTERSQGQDGQFYIGGQVVEGRLGLFFLFLQKFSVYMVFFTIVVNLFRFVEYCVSFCTSCLSRFVFRIIRFFRIICSNFGLKQVFIVCRVMIIELGFRFERRNRCYSYWGYIGRAQ